MVHWDIRERMTTKEIEIIVQRARGRFPGVKPRIVSDNGPQFIAKEFKEFIRICEMKHVRISPGYRWVASAKEAKTASARNSVQIVFQNRSIFPSVIGWCGALRTWLIP
jgi:hypothetical protein